MSMLQQTVNPVYMDKNWKLVFEVMLDTVL